MSRLPTSSTRSKTPLGRLTTNAASGSLTRRRLGSRRVQLYFPRCQQQYPISAAPGAHGRVHAATTSGSESHPHRLLWEQQHPDVTTTTSSSSGSGSSKPSPLKAVCSSWHPLLQRCWLGLGALTLFLALPAGSVSTRHAAAAATAATPHITATADIDSSSSRSSSIGPARPQPTAAAAAAAASAGDDSTGGQAASSSSGSRWWWRNVAADVATGGSSSSSTVSREGLADPSALRADPVPLPPPPVPPPPPPAPSLPPPLPAPPPPPTTITTPDGLLPHERTAALLFAANVPSVVNISHPRSSQNFYTLDITRMAVGQGSGFIWDRLGHVITNYHLIKGAAEVKVTLSDYTSCTARVVGCDASRDLALLRLALPRARLEALRPAVIGSSAGLQIGQSVYALGNPFGLDATLSVGVVSGLGREAPAGLFPLKGLIQTDAAINPGNSGGPLLNSQGQVIGLNVALSDANARAGFPGVGFALPIDGLKGLVGQLLATGRVRRPALGVALAPKQVLAALGVEGVLVLEVPAGSPAAAAGLRPTSRDVFGDLVLGDIIVGLDTRPVGGARDLVAALDERKPGDKVRCDVLRDGKRLSMTVTLTERGPGTAEE